MNMKQRGFTRLESLDALRRLDKFFISGFSVLGAVFLSVLCLTARADASPTARACWCDAVISPEIGTPLAGYNANDISVAKADDLMLCAVGVDDGESRIFIFAFDLLGIDARNIVSFRADVAKALGVQPACVLFTCTHTHGGPFSL